MSDNILWDYVEQESDDLLLELRDRVERDGFAAAADGDVELVSMMVLSTVSMKNLALTCENLGTDLSEKYMELVRGQVELLKLYVMKQFRQEV